MQERTLTYDKDRVLARLRSNREDHRGKVLIAQKCYQEMVTAELEQRLGQAREGKPIDPAFLGIYPIPQDYTREYDRVIDRLETTDATKIELTDQEFNQWMRDEWDWHARFVGSTQTYLAGS